MVFGEMDPEDLIGTLNASDWIEVRIGAVPCQSAPEFAEDYLEGHVPRLRQCRAVIDYEPSLLPDPPAYPPRQLHGEGSWNGVLAVDVFKVDRNASQSDLGEILAAYQERNVIDLLGW